MAEMFKKELKKSEAEIQEKNVIIEELNINAKMELTRASDYVSNLKNELVTLKGENESLIQTVDTLQQENSTLKNAHNEESEKFFAFRETQNQLIIENSSLVNTTETLQFRIVEAELSKTSACNELQHVRTQLNARITDLDDQLSQLELDRNYYRDKASALSTELQTCHESITEFETVCDISVKEQGIYNLINSQVARSCTVS
jgi:chromosome segregation ATPase